MYGESLLLHLSRKRKLELLLRPLPRLVPHLDRAPSPHRAPAHAPAHRPSAHLLLGPTALSRLQRLPSPAHHLDPLLVPRKRPPSVVVDLRPPLDRLLTLLLARIVVVANPVVRAEKANGPSERAKSPKRKAAVAVVALPVAAVTVVAVAAVTAAEAKAAVGASPMMKSLLLSSEPTRLLLLKKLPSLSLLVQQQHPPLTPTTRSARCPWPPRKVRWTRTSAMVVR